MVGLHSRAGPVKRGGSRAVGGAVIDEKDLPGAGVCREVGDGFSKHDGETSTLVVGGYDDGDDERWLGLRAEHVREWARGGNNTGGEDSAVELLISSFEAWGMRNEEDEEVGLCQLAWRLATG